MPTSRRTIVLVDAHSCGCGLSWERGRVVIDVMFSRKEGRKIDDRCTGRCL